MKRLLFTPLLFCLALSLQSQSLERTVIAPAGNSFFDGTSAYVDYTVGEIVITTMTNSNNILTQGFQQPFSNTYVTVEENVSNPIQVFIYPNPVIDQLNISIENGKPAEYRVVLFDVLGQVMVDNRIIQGYDGKALITLDLGRYATGNYYLRISTDINLIQTGKIIKISQ